MKAWKVQKFFGDLLYDLRSRNLLPVVILLAVGLVAVPLLISRGSKGADVSLAPTSSSAVGSPLTQNAVVAYHPPGLRNAKSRLNDLGPKNPFVQQYTNSGAPKGGSSTTTGGPALDQFTANPADYGNGSSGSSTSSGGTGGGSGGGGGGNGGSSGGNKTKTVYSYYQTDVTIGEAGGQQVAAHNLKQFQFLPSPDKPALVYMGTASAGKQALFLVSKDVTSVGGAGVCFPNADDCQLLGLNAGAGADFYYAPDGKTYHVQVTRIRHVTSTQPPG
jgi:hypothetical protein